MTSALPQPLPQKWYISLESSVSNLIYHVLTWMSMCSKHRHAPGLDTWKQLLDLGCYLYGYQVALNMITLHVLLGQIRYPNGDKYVLSPPTALRIALVFRGIESEVCCVGRSTQTWKQKECSWLLTYSMFQVTLYGKQKVPCLLYYTRVEESVAESATTGISNSSSSDLHSSQPSPTVLKPLVRNVACVMIELMLALALLAIILV